MLFSAILSSFVSKNILLVCNFKVLHRKRDFFSTVLKCSASKKILFSAILQSTALKGEPDGKNQPSGQPSFFSGIFKLLQKYSVGELLYHNFSFVILICYFCNLTSKSVI